ncbi:MAG: type I methionyl aminopeptidase [Bacillota bacterium]|nr:type I methionyl aminopeptidase [Bacillota bacterium]
MIVLKSPQEIKAMRKAGQVVARVLAKLGEMIRPGITTGALDRAAEDLLREWGAVPAFKGYRPEHARTPFPASICTSVDNQVVHGIPGPRVLQEGQIVSIDVGAIVDGFCGDAARTFPVGEISPEAARLLVVTEEALEKGIERARVGNRLSDISHAIQQWVEAHGFSVVRELVGHGIGRQMHEPPPVPNAGPPGRGPRLKPGMVLAIEPMVNAGAYGVKTKADGWTVVTEDGSLSAHFEHTVAITADGPQILTSLS